jgi:hypothetical protein
LKAILMKSQLGDGGGGGGDGEARVTITGIDRERIYPWWRWGDNKS